MKISFALSVRLVVVCISLGGVEVLAQSTDVTIALVTRTSAGPDDVTVVLPDQQTDFPLGDMVVEVWAQTMAPVGLAQVSVDFSFPQGVFTVTSVTHTTQFSLFAVDTIDNVNGLVDDLSGSVPPTIPACGGHVGASPEWARVAIIDMQATEIGLTDFVIGPTNNIVFVNANCGSIDPPVVTFLGASVAIGLDGVQVPTASSWGLLAMALLLLIFGTARMRRIQTLRVER